MKYFAGANQWIHTSRSSPHLIELYPLLGRNYLVYFLDDHMLHFSQNSILIYVVLQMYIVTIPCLHDSRPGGDQRKDRIAYELNLAISLRHSDG
jgi:hypothetical protein